MRLEDVETFVHIVTARTLGQCALDMHLTQSTVSKRLQRLEDDLGVRLVERHKGLRTVSLTRAGTRFLDTAHRWLAIQNEVDWLHETRERLPLGIGSLASQNFAFLNQVYSLLTRHRPALQLNVMQRHSDEMYNLIEKKELTVGFSINDLFNPSVRARPCYEEPMLGVRLATSALREMEVVKTSSLAAENEVFMGWGTIQRNWHVQHWDHARHGRIRVDNVNILMELLSTPDHWGIVPYTLAKAYMGRIDTLETFRIVPKPPDRRCYILTHKNLSEENREALSIFSSYLIPILYEVLDGNGRIYDSAFLPG